MRTVAEPSQDIIGKFRDRQKTRLERTFVGAAEAAQNKVNASSYYKSFKVIANKMIFDLHFFGDTLNFNLKFFIVGLRCHQGNFCQMVDVLCTK